MAWDGSPGARLRRLTWTIRAGVALGLTASVWAAWPAQDADPDFRPRVAAPAFVRSSPASVREALRGPVERWPRVAIDQGHSNIHNASGRYAPFARLLERDGFRVVPSDGRITAAALRGADVFVTANPLGFRGLVQHAANLAGLERVLDLRPDAFADDEIETLAAWVHGGGRALLIADHRPAGDAARRLAAAFGVEMTTWWAEDAEHHDAESHNPGHLVFSGGLLGDHPILRGRSGDERVSRVITFTGQALRPGPDGTALLRLSPSAREYPYRVSREQQGRPAAGLAQAVAVLHGSGRVVIIGDAAALTAQRIETPGAPPFLIGMNRSGADNQQFVLNVMHWLMGLL